MEQTARIQDDAQAEEGSRIYDAIRVLERRQVALRKRIGQHVGSQISLTYDEKEVAAIDVALDALRLQWSKVRNLDNPIIALERLVAACGSSDKKSILDAMSKAQEVLSDYG